MHPELCKTESMGLAHSTTQQGPVRRTAQWDTVMDQLSSVGANVLIHANDGGRDMTRSSWSQSVLEADQ